MILNTPLNAATTSIATPSKAPARPERVTSIDAYRGFVMFLMLAEVLRLSRVSEALPHSSFWSFLSYHQSHVEWVGCSLHDLIQPSFSFLVGVALPFSISGRLARGQSMVKMALHAWWRALLLILLGVFLRSTHAAQTYWTFEDTLSQIGLGYGALFLLGLRPVRDQWIALAAILVGYWAAFALYPLPGPGHVYSDVGVSAEWLQAHGLTGFAQHWQKNGNLAWAFDTWFLNLFPRESVFTRNSGGYSTLSFIPTLGTMILGSIAGNMLKSDRAQWKKAQLMALAGLVLLAAGWLLGALGICPVVKRIWTPAWVLFSGGWCFLLLAGFYAAVDLWRAKSWAFPLVVVGMNSIAAYSMDHLVGGFIFKALKTHLGEGVFMLAGPAYQPLLLGAAVLSTFWLILFWMYRRKIFLKI